MKEKVVYNSKWLKKARINSIVIYPTVYFKDNRSEISPIFAKRTLHHLKLARKYRLLYYFSYFWSLLTSNFWNNPFTKESYNIQQELFDDDELDLLDKCI